MSSNLHDRTDDEGAVQAEGNRPMSVTERDLRLWAR